LLTLRGPNGPRRGADLRNLGIIQDGAVLIARGLIVEVGPTRRLENLALARDAEEIDATGCVVMPGLVDSDIQLVKEPARDLTPRAIRAAALRELEDAVRCGTTAMEAKAGELKTLRVYAALRELPLTLVSTFAASDVSSESCERLLPLLRRRKLADFAEIGCQDGPILAKAQELGWPLKLRGSSNPGAIATAVQIGATAVKGLFTATEYDAMLLAQSPAIVTLSPGFAAHGETTHAVPSRVLIDSGAAVALASAGQASNLQMTIGLACRDMNMTPAEAIAAATINGAHAIGRARRVGSIEAGKSADLAILGVPDYRELPYHFGVNLVNMAMIRGLVRVERSEVKWPAR